MSGLPDLERHVLIVIGGSFEGGKNVPVMGHIGTYSRDCLTIPATGCPHYVRYGEVSVSKIVQSHCLWDPLGVIRLVGFRPLAPSLGTEGMLPNLPPAKRLLLAPLHSQ